MSIDRSYRRHLASIAQADLSPHVREQILSRQNRLCFYCDQPLVGGQYVLDHVVPRHAGGAHGPVNRVAAHPPCDMAKGGRMPTDAELGKLRLQMEGVTP